MQCVKLLVNKEDREGNSYDHHCDTLLPVNINLPGLSVEAIKCTPLSRDIGCSVMKITDPECRYADCLNFEPINNDCGSCEIMRVNRTQYVAMITNQRCKLASLLSKSGCFLTSAVPVGQYKTELTMIGLNKSYIKILIENLVEKGYGVKTLSVSEMNAEPILTAKQERCIKIAYENGYYDVPKSITLDELEELAGNAKSTLSVMLREAERKIITNYLEMN